MRNKPIVTLRLEDADLARSLVLYEDRSIIALNKPSGLACQTRKRDDLTLDRLLWAFAKSNGKRPHLVHRLDRETSGLVLAARTKPAAANLHQAFETRRVKKTYLALVRCGNAVPASGEIAVPLMEQRVGSEVRSVVSAPEDPGAKSARTSWQCLGQTEGAALLRVSPHTGRMHQIRAHMAHAGMPLIGDRQYGGRSLTDQMDWPRTLLHAQALAFDHPEPTESRKIREPGVSIVNTHCVLHAPVPEDFEDAAARLGLSAIVEAALAAGVEPG